MQYALLIYSTEESTPEERRVVEAGVAPVLARPYVSSWARLHAPQTATTVRQQQGETLLTDGPFVDTKEFLGGLIVIEVDNLDVALAVAAELQALRPSSAIEVRPVRDEVPWWRLRGSSATTGDGCSRPWSGCSGTSSWPRTWPRRPSRSRQSAGPATASPPTRPPG